MLSKLALGTVQFGMKYGISNQAGKVPREDVQTIMALARDAGINMLDTAISYGDSEQTLGEIGVRDWEVITKLPLVPQGCSDVSEWVHRQLLGSLQRLRSNAVDVLMLHHSHQVPGPIGKDLVRALQEVKDRGLVRQIGVSIYDPNELDLIGNVAPFDVVQAPVNVLDKKLITSGWLTRLHDSGIEVHTRSTFLQGLLLMESALRPAKFDRWHSLWNTWDAWLERCHLTPLQACLQYALSVEVDRVIVGVETPDQLKQILAVGPSPRLAVPPEIDSIDVDLINPSRW